MILQGTFLFGNKIQLDLSKKHIRITNAPLEFQLNDGTSSVKDYLGDRWLNRFNTKEMARKNRILPPTKVIHFYGVPREMSESDIEEMFSFADKNKDGKLSYKEFEVNGHLIYFDIISKFFKDDDRSPDPPLGVQAPHYRHRSDPPGVQSSGQAGGPVKLCLSNTAGLQGDVLLAELPGQLQADQLGQLHHGENRVGHLKLHQHCKYLK